MHASFTALRQAFATARHERKARHRDIASALSISEGELLAAHTGSFAEDESPLGVRTMVGAAPRALKFCELPRRAQCVSVNY